MNMAPTAGTKRTDEENMEPGKKIQDKKIVTSDKDSREEQLQTAIQGLSTSKDEVQEQPEGQEKPDWQLAVESLGSKVDSLASLGSKVDSLASLGSKVDSLAEALGSLMSRVDKRKKSKRLKEKSDSSDTLSTDYDSTTSIKSNGKDDLFLDFHGGKQKKALKERSFNGDDSHRAPSTLLFKDRPFLARGLQGKEKSWCGKGCPQEFEHAKREWPAALKSSQGLGSKGCFREDRGLGSKGCFRKDQAPAGKGPGFLGGRSVKEYSSDNLYRRVKPSEKYDGFHNTRARDENKSRERFTLENSDEDNLSDGAITCFDFDIHRECGPRAYYHSFPAPWDTVPDIGNTKDCIPMLQGLNKSIIDPFEAQDANDYARWRSQVISFVHLRNATVQCKITAVSSLLTKEVKDNLEINIEYSPLGYLNLIRALESGFGGSRRLLKAATLEVKKLESFKLDRLEELQHYIRVVNTYFQRLEEAGLHADINTVSCFNDVVAPWPWVYHREYREWLEQAQEDEDAKNALDWIKRRFAILRQIPKKDKPTVQSKYLKTFVANTEVEGQATHTVDPGDVDERSQAQRECVVIENGEEEVDWTMLSQGFRSKQPDRGCLFCGRKAVPHNMADCPAVLRLLVSERRNLFAELKLCFICASPQHFSNKCTAQIRCSKCTGSHHSILHLEEKQNAFKTSFNGRKKPISLKSVTVKLLNTRTGRSILANGLLDSADEHHLLSKTAAERLGLKGYKVPINVKGVGGLEKQFEAVIAEVQVCSPKGEGKRVVPVRVIENPAGDFAVADPNKIKYQFPEMQDVDLAPVVGDGEVDIILGCETPRFLSHEEERWSEDDNIALVKTPLGWTIFGKTDKEKKIPNADGADIPCMLSNTQACIPDEPKEWFQSFTFSMKEPRGDEALEQGLKVDSGLGDGNGAKEDEMDGVEALGKLVKTCMWEVNERGEDLVMSAEERYALNLMKKSRKKVGNHYEISCLWKKGCPTLRNNAGAALSRLDSLNKMRLFTPDVRKKYEAVIYGWVEKKYMEEIPVSALHEKNSWILPHFPVVKRDGGIVKKVRPVLDGAAEYKGQSLNRQIMSGPNLLGDLVKILLRFRRKPVCLAADVKDMFLQIGLDERSKKYHRIVWRDGAGTLRLFQFRVHAFGNAGSGAVANFNVQQIAAENREVYPEAAEAILESTLMDDSMDSFDDAATAQRVAKDLKTLFAEAGMHVHKFLSNVNEVLENIPVEDKASTIDVGTQEGDSSVADTRVLGIRYSSVKDEFYFNPRLAIQPDALWTKRKILSTFPRIFDPMGYLQPCQLVAKNIFQEITMRGTGWDEEAPVDLGDRWKTWLAGLSDLKDIRIPRCTMKMGVGNKGCSRAEDPIVERIHVFMDASEKGYSAVAYRTSFYTLEKNETGYSALLMSKSKVAPLKVLCMPRMELLAAELALKLYLEIKRVHKLPDRDMHFHTDSVDVLCWLATETRRLQRFVAHRVAKLQDLTPTQNWHYIRSADNPSDVGSRGCTVAELAVDKLWWKGPPSVVQVREPVYEYPSITRLSAEAQKEVKNDESKGKVMDGCAQHSLVAATDPYGKLDAKAKGRLTRKLRVQEEERLHPKHFSRLDRFLRVIAWMRRWSGGVPGGQRLAPRAQCSKHQSSQRPLSKEELIQTELMFLEFVQYESFHETIAQLRKQGRCRHDDKLAPWNPIIDQGGILRVGGRLAHSEKIPAETRCPILLPHNYAGRMVMERIHEEQQHMVGHQTLLAAFGERYAMLGARATAKRVCHECVKCKKLMRTPYKVPMGPLPDMRLGERGKREPIFATCQLDVAGPYRVKMRTKGRWEKRWLLMTVCTVYRAVSIEVLPSMESASLLLAVQRTMDRRGPIGTVYCDNAKTFKGAENTVQSIAEIIDPEECRKKYPLMEWNFGPPMTPHYQGLAEAEIKSMKRALDAVLSPNGVSDEELLTFVCTVEAMMNKRPLTYVDAGGELLAVTPADFLGVNGLHRAFPKLLGKDIGRVKGFAKRWLQVNKLLDVWWERYLGEMIPMMHRLRKKRMTPAIQEGSVVICLEEKGDRGVYPLARIEKVLESRDGIIRKVEINLGGKRYIRHVSKLSLLVQQ